MCHVYVAVQLARVRDSRSFGTSYTQLVVQIWVSYLRRFILPYCRALFLVRDTCPFPLHSLFPSLIRPIRLWCKFTESSISALLQLDIYTNTPLYFLETNFVAQFCPPQWTCTTNFLPPLFLSLSTRYPSPPPARSNRYYFNAAFWVDALLCSRTLLRETLYITREISQISIELSLYIFATELREVELKY